MLPILTARFCMGVLVVLAGTPIAPFIDTLFHRVQPRLEAEPCAAG
jgi:hypothetical protein